MTDIYVRQEMVEPQPAPSRAVGPWVWARKNLFASPGDTLLTLVAAAFLGETVRAGILSVSRGQTEAAQALGLMEGDRLRLVIIPQAMRVIIPPLTSQYLNLTKNSSLGAAIGFPELVNVWTGTTLNQTGRAIEVIFLTMAVYATFSLLTSLVMNWYNGRVALVER
jgi:general L-amino acid transport system permease protein